MNDNPFGAERDELLGQQLRDAMTPPDPEGFAARLRLTLVGLPERTSQWDVLAGWARPSVLAAAAIAGFALGVALWQSWRERSAPPAPTSVATTILEQPRPAEPPILYAVLEER